jgi:hypothetical protein
MGSDAALSLYIIVKMRFETGIVRYNHQCSADTLALLLQNFYDRLAVFVIKPRRGFVGK